MPRRLVAPLVLAIALCTPAPVRSEAPGPGAPSARWDGARLSMTARGASFETVAREFSALTGAGLLGTPAPGTRLDVAFEGLIPVRAAAVIGGALGGLIPLTVVQPWAEAQEGTPPRTDIFLVPAGTRERRLLDAFCVPDVSPAKAPLLQEIRMLGPATIPDLARMVREPSRAAPSRLAAVKLLGETRDPGALPLLEALLLGDPDPLAREAAAVALGHSGLPAALPALRRALEDREAAVALRAGWALARLGDLGGAAAALAHLGHSRTDLALRALETLEALGRETDLPALRAHLAGAVGLRHRLTEKTIAAITLGGLPPAEHAGYCARLLENDEPELRRFGASHLATRDDPAADEALAAIAGDLQHPGREEATLALRARQRSPAGGQYSVIDDAR